MKRFKKFLPQIVRNAVLSNGVSLFIFFVIWVVLFTTNSRPWPLFSSIHLNASVEDVTLPSLPLSLHLIYHLFVTGLIIQLISEASKRISEIIFTEKLRFRNRFLLESITSNQFYFNMLGFNLLNWISKEDQDARQFLYTYNAGEGWNIYLNCCMRILNDLIDSLEYYKESRRKSLSEGDRPIEHSFDSLQLQIWAIESIAQFTAKSLNEDSIGVVQNNNTVPVLLDSLFRAKSAVEEYIHSLSSATFPNEMNSFATSNLFKSNMKKPSLNLSFLPKDQTPFRGVPKAKIMQEVLDRAISVIVNEFRDRLNYFDFTPSVASRLQSHY
eukprot:TRINITY_DN5229_c0_g1_i3.p1 TRINITY_DN5229_c0_g1~~TRINITY_DN5229_c0_g1_i3.p1  ORF type:complete len:327 (-),score=108.84 TRINITY_DN5229_c0_g1_i3:19-999(-)